MAASTNNNMYRVGDYVYFEVSASTPYQVRRIEELNKAPSGDVEAKVACFFRRRDLTNTLLHQAARYYDFDSDGDDESPEAKNSDSVTSSPPPKPNLNESNSENGNSKKASLSQVQKHHLKHRELFLSRQVEVLPAKHIRGKCSVTLYNNVEPLSNYLGREDAFYYKLIYDPMQKTLQEDRGTLRIGLEYQCPIQPLLKDQSDPRMSQNWEQLSWNPFPNHSDFETFLTLCRSVGTYARAYDPITLLSSKGGSPQALNLMTAVASANRDMTLQLAHDLLHEANYDLKKAMHLLTPEGRPLMCKDQLDVWSPNEIQLFEEALDKYSKVFTDIHHEYLPWKEHQAIVELYYFWKTTDRYVKRRRMKLTAQEHKLKQVYIPNYNKPNQSVLFQNAAPSHLVSKKASTGCDSCTAQQSTQWYAWGPSSMLCKLCTGCWQYWKKFGGLKTPDASNKERLEAAANAQKSETNSASSIVPNGNLNINVFGASSRAGQRQVEGPFGGCLPLVFDQGGPVGTVCQMTPSFIRITRITSPKFINPHKLARKLSLFAWATVKNQSIEEVTDYESLLKKMKEIAKEAMKDDDLKRSAVIKKLENRSRTAGDMKILQCIDKVAALSGIEFTSEESKAIVKSLKRTAPEDSELDGPAAKKLASPEQA